MNSTPPDKHPEKTHDESATSFAPPEFARDVCDYDLTPILKSLLSGNSLSSRQTVDIFQAMMTGQAHPGEVGAFLALLATRTPTSSELLGAAKVMRQHVDIVPYHGNRSDLVDTAGTGGAPKTFNVSTIAAIIAAGAGARVAKHGNRSRTKRGSAEVLAKLGVNIDADRATQARCLEEAGVCFCFAIHHHPATKHVMPIRRALGFPTIFNLLGPLTNPAGAQRQLIGVYDSQFLRPVAEALVDLGAVHAMVVHSEDGLDEMSISAPTHILRIEQGQIHEQLLGPPALGLEIAERSTVTALDLDHAAEMILDILDGHNSGPARDMALLNAAAALVVADKAENLEDGLRVAAESVDSGRARRTLDHLAKLSQGN